MDVKKQLEDSGELYVSTSVIEKISKLACLEVEDVVSVTIGSSGVKGVFVKTNLPKSVEVTVFEGVAEITVHIVIKYGSKAMSVSKLVQENVKLAVQNMTNIAVSRVNVVIAGVEQILPEE